MKNIYLDHCATTPLHPEVLEEMLPYLKKDFGNPSSTYSLGQKARKAVDDAREKVAFLIGADPSEIVFTGGGTEADNLALRGAAYAKRRNGKHIITSSIEHHAVINTCRYLEGEGFIEEKGFRVTYLPVDKYGLVNPDDVKKSINDDTILISIMHANNEVGTIEPISEIGEIARERQINFHTDAVQSVGKIPVRVEELKVDLLSLSGHKIYGPKGVGALYIRRGVSIVPLFFGGHHESNFRAGTENVASIVGLGKACEIASRDMERSAKYLAGLRDKLQAGINKGIEQAHFNGHPTRRLSNILNLSFKFIEGEAILLNLDMKGIAVSTGPACTSGSWEPSHVLMAMGVDRTLAQGSLRLSPGMGNTDEDIAYTIETLVEVIKRLRYMSPLSTAVDKNNNGKSPGRI